MDTKHTSNGELLVHTTTKLNDCDWDRIKYIGADSGKSNSRFIQDCVMEFIDSGAKVKESDTPATRRVSLAFTENSFNKMKEYCKSQKCSLKDLIINSVLN